eukprot:5454840-Lingulodinium_polyedra.AAC.1
MANAASRWASSRPAPRPTAPSWSSPAPRAPGRLARRSGSATCGRRRSTGPAGASWSSRGRTGTSWSTPSMWRAASAPAAAGPRPTSGSSAGRHASPRACWT